MSNAVESLKKRIAGAEAEVEKLSKQLKWLQSLIENGDSVENNDLDENTSPEVAAVFSKNIKLKHRLSILNRGIEEEKRKSASTAQGTTKSKISMDSSSTLQGQLTHLFTVAIQKAFPDVPDFIVPISSATNIKFGDYQCNAAMPITQQLKHQGINKSPRDVAKQIVDNLPTSKLVNKTEIAGPGFINIWLDKSVGLAALTDILKHGVRPSPLKKRLRVVVDFSSPNIAKEMHVGHLRSTIIGDSICKLLEFLGHDVLRLNHVGDWGTQFGMLIAHLQDKFPDYLTVSPPVSDLQAFYKESKKRFDEDEPFKQRAYKCVVQLQKGESDYIKAWKLICDVSRKEFQKVYDRLNVKVTERGESFYQKRMEQIVNFLEEKGLLEEDEGRKVMFGQVKGQIPLTIVKSDGGFTYDTSDMAALKQRIEEEHADWVIYVTDSGQATHFKVIESCGRRAGFVSDSFRFDFVGFGVVLGEDKKKFKTRSGDTVRLVDLLDEGVKRARETLESRDRHLVMSEAELKAAENSVAYGCIKYSDLAHNRINDYIFSFDKMLEDKGNTAVYLLYAYTRICSIARNANVTPQQIKHAIDTGVPISLEHEKEWKLAKVLLKFEDVLLRITQDLSLHHLCEFIYEVAVTFTEFYDCCYCIVKDPKTGEIKSVDVGRLLLCEVTANVLAKCFDIVGLVPVSKM